MRQLFLFGLVLLSFYFLQCKSTDIQEEKHSIVSIDSMWQQYELYTSKQRPESAENVLDSIMQVAKRQNDDPQLVKAIWLKYQSISRKEGGTIGIDYLTSVLKDEDGDIKPLLHYMSALGYFHYYNSNQWEINSRTAYASSREEAVDEWGHRQFLETIYEHLFESVDSSLLYESTLKWTPVLKELDSTMVEYRPVLYDVIVPEVAEILSRSEMQILPLAELKWLKDPALLKDRTSFNTLKIQDSLNNLDEAVRFYQQWFQKRANNEEVLAHADLSRLQFFHAHSRHPDKDQLFLEALEHFEDAYEDEYALAHALYLQAQLYQQWHDKPMGEGKNAYQMAIQSVQELQMKYPRTPYAKAAQNIVNEIKQAVLTVEVEKVNLPQKPILVSLKTKNLDHFTLEVYEIKYEDLEGFRKTYLRDFPEFLKKLERIANMEYQLPQSNDYELQTYEVGFPGIQTGLYIMVAKAKESVHWQSFEVSDLATYTIGGNQVMVTDRINGEAVNNAKVTIEERDWRRSSHVIKTYTTNKEGTTIIDVSNRNNYVIQKVEKGERVHYPELNVFNSYTEGATDPRTRIHLLTDRSIYRPGQTVYYKGIVYRQESRSDWSIQEHKKVEVQLRDQNGQTIGKTEKNSNSWGSIEGFFHIPEEVLTGTMMIHTPFGQTHIRVEEYKRPTFTVELELEKAKKYTIGDSIQINGLAETLNGIPIDNAEVSYTVRRQYYTPWYYRYFPPINKQEVEISSGILQSGTDGEFEIKFLAEADTSLDYARYLVKIEVTDIGGETQTAEKSLSLSRKPFQLVGDVSKLLTKEELKTMSFKAVNHFGDTLNETVNVTLSQMSGPEAGKIDRYWMFPDSILMSEEKFRSDFENYAFHDLSSPKTWEFQSTVGEMKIEFDGSRTLPDELINNISKGWYQLQFNSEGGEEINTYYFELFDAKVDVSSTQPMLKLVDPVMSMEVGQHQAFKYVKPFEHSKVYTAIYYPESRHKLEWSRGNSIDISPKEGDRGGLGINLISVHKNRIYTEHEWIDVPWTNKELQIHAKTFREVLKPGVDEKWTFTVSDPNSEMAAVLYDAALDEIYDHDWSGIPFPNYRPYIRISHNSFHSVHLRRIIGFDRDYESVQLPEYPNFIFNLIRSHVYHRVIDPETYSEEIAVRRDAMEEGAGDIVMNETKEAPSDQQKETESTIRENLNETVFFYPQLQNEDGVFEIEFTMGEALTAWNLFLFAHTKELKTSVKELQVKTRKELMIRPQLPRFFRSGDSIQIVGRIQNQTDEDQEIEAKLILKDALKGEVINSKFGIQKHQKTISIPAGSSKAVRWRLFIPDAQKVPAVRVEMYAETDEWTDGEANILPVVNNRILLTEARPLEIGANSNLSFNLKSWSQQWLVSKTAKPLEYGLEFTKQPLWYAVQALPYLAGSEYDCSEQLVNRLYANALAAKIAEEIPNLSQIFDQMEEEGKLKSPLQLDDQWKSVDLNATPWLKNAIAETQRMQNIQLLLDVDRRRYEQGNIIRKLQQWQNADGGFPWFKGGRSNNYMTQYICIQILRMQRMELISGDIVNSILNRAIQYCDREFMEWYKDYQMDPELTGLSQLHYYYLKSLQEDLPNTDAWNTLDRLLKEHWTLAGLYNQALLARSWQLQNNAEMAGQLLISFKERAIQDSMIGAYWNQSGLRRTYVDHIELHALMIEVFESAGNTEFSNELKTWLIKNKQTNHWTNTKSTAAAIHALLLRGTSGLEDNGSVEVSADGSLVPWTSSSVIDEWHQSYERSAEDQSGYPFELVKVRNERSHPVWGAAYIQYSEQMDAVHSGLQHGLTIKKKYFKEEWSVTGSRLIPLENTGALQPGDILVARIIVSVDRSMDFVHLKSERPSNMEPLRQLSGYTFRDGIAYYESVKDLATHFFIDHLPKGTFVFEHRERVALVGECMGGISQIESMYAPEFRAHTSGKRIKTDDK